MVGVNRVGVDGNSLEYSGDSMAFDQHGSVLLDLGSRAAVETVCFSASALLAYRDSFPTALDADRFTVDL